MRTATLFVLGILVLSGCARQEIPTTGSSNSAPATNSDAVGPTVLFPLPGITEDHPAPQTTLGLDIAETAQAEKPDDPTANLNLGLSYYKAKSYADAARVFARTAQLMPENTVPLIYLGYTQMAVGALDGALKTMERVLTTKGVSRDTLSDAYYAIGVCKATLNQKDEAIVSYTKALGNNPKNGMASLALGARAAERGQVGQAKDFFTDAANDLPISRHKAQAYAALGKLSESQKDTKTAIEHYKMAIKVDRDNQWADEALQRLAPGKIR